ncbi:MAG: hypothetical protein QOH49_1383 [Acidobacteriota bacterium]|jgi:hypothetical protein|nr:hypothetical protein [Acidobacteriota bacterium]
MTTRALQAPRFVRRTQLGPGEYRKNFRQVDGDIIAAVTSPEADRVTSLMSKIYLRLVNVPAQYWERDGVLRFEGELSGDKRVTAWEALCEAVSVASATANKALRWMHEQGIIGYFAGKNGAGIRIFLNRATSSIGTRTAGKKILEFTRASFGEDRTSLDEAAFSDSYADLEVSDTDINPRAPKNGAETKPVGKTSPPAPPPAPLPCSTRDHDDGRQSIEQPGAGAVPVEEIVERLRNELEPHLRETAARAAAQSASREMERMREWFEMKALPKAVRVAQREAYDLLRKQGGSDGRRGRASAELEVGRAAEDYTASAARPLTTEEIREAAESCIALLEAQGKSIEMTLSEISSESGGWLLPEDAPRVREAVRELLPSSGEGARLEAFPETPAPTTACALRPPQTPQRAVQETVVSL